MRGGSSEVAFAALVVEPWKLLNWPPGSAPLFKTILQSHRAGTWGLDGRLQDVGAEVLLRGTSLRRTSRVLVRTGRPLARTPSPRSEGCVR